MANSAESTKAQSVQALTTLASRRTSGFAVQYGSLLVIAVDAPKLNTVELSSLNFGQVVQAEWNGGPVHDFAGVSTIIVDTTNGQKDLIALDVATTTATRARPAPSFASHIA